MQISMKRTQMERLDLVSRMQGSRRSMGLSYTDLGARCGVDPSQVSRICRGEFVTFSDSVLRICTELDVSIPDGTAAPRTGRDEAVTGSDWTKLERSVRKAWDKTSAGADRLAKVIAAVADLNRR